VHGETKEAAGAGGPALPWREFGAGGMSRSKVGGIGIQGEPAVFLAYMLPQLLTRHIGFKSVTRLREVRLPINARQADWSRRSSQQGTADGAEGARDARCRVTGVHERAVIVFEKKRAVRGRLGRYH